MPSSSTTSLLDALRQFHLLDHQQLEELVRGPAASAEPKALAGELIRRGWLTPFQANQLLQGKGQELLLGSYILLERLGEGGMGAVFKARNWKLGRIVALKLIRKERLDNPNAIRRFQREVRAAAALDHPNIVLAYDADEIGGTHILVMECIEGATDLAHLVKKNGPLLIAPACEYIRQAALGLQHAYERGLVHRDIKPANLLLTADGQTVKILDMGLARLDHTGSDDDKSSTMSQDGMVMGTPDYIAPEQAMASHSVDIRADLYSLGCTFYHLLTGRVPFAGGSLTEKLIKHQLHEPPPVERWRADVPPAVAEVMRKLMAKQPSARYQTPAEAAAALAAVSNAPAPTALRPAAARDAGQRTKAAGGESDSPTGVNWSSVVNPTLPEAAGKRPRGQKTLRDHRRLWLLGAGSAVLLAGLVVLMLVLTRLARNATPQARQQPDGSISLTNNLDMEFVLIPRGKSWLGGGEGKPGDKQVDIPYDFYLGKYEVTQGQWVKVMGRNPSFFSRTGAGKEFVKDVADADLDLFPVEQVSWEDAQVFLKEVHRQAKDSGWVYRLPTEVEWEYACRGGPLVSKAASAFEFYLDQASKQLSDGLANCNQFLKRTCKVGSYRSNRLGLHDMHGNVWEWCDDVVDQRVAPGGMRGGSWYGDSRTCRAGYRFVSVPTRRDDSLGLRLARVPVGR